MIGTKGVLEVADEKGVKVHVGRDALDPESELMQVLGPIIKVFKVLGSWPRNENQFILRLNPWNGLCLFILHFYTIHKFFNWMTVVKHTENFFAVFEQLSVIIRTAVVAITFDLRFTRHTALIGVFQEIETFPTFNSDYKITKLRGMIRGIIVGCVIFVLLHITLASALLFHKNTEGYVNWLFYGDSTENTHQTIVRVVMITDWFLYLFLVICNECFSKALYISLCLILRQKIRDYNEFLRRLEEKKIIRSAHQVQELYRLHSRLSTIVDGIEGNLSFPAFLWVVCIIFNLCVKIEAIVSGIAGAEFEEFGYIMTDVLYYIIAFVVITLVASEVGEENLGPVVSVTKMAEEGEIEDFNFQQETQLLLTKLNTRMMRLTGWSCFELNKGFLLTILGALATYTIVILQMA